MVDTAPEYSHEQLMNKWEKFFETRIKLDPDSGKPIDTDPYLSKIMQIADSYPDKKTLYIRFPDIDWFDEEFGRYLLLKPYNSIYAGENAIINLLTSDQVDAGVKIHLRITNLPDIQHINISQLRAEHLGQLVAVEGLVKKALEVRPFLQKGVFQCIRCYAIITVVQESLMFKEPMECTKEQGGCGRAAASTVFKLLTEKSNHFDFQKIELQERPENLPVGRTPERIEVHADDDITGQITPGDRIVVNGILRSYQKLTKFKTKSNLFDIFIECNSIQTEQKNYEDIKLTDQDIEEIKKASQDPEVFDKIVMSIAPSIYGMAIQKEAIALMLFGGVRKDELPDGTEKRGDIHMLLVGDPGIAKTGLLDYVARLSPRGIYASGKTTTSAGLTAAALRDEFSEGRWTLEAGAMALANGGLAAIDEIDKMNEQDRSAIHEAMEQQRITINKAGMNVTLPSVCSVLAAGNPKYGRYDQYRPFSEQIDLSPPLLSRFDLIFPLRDIPDKDTDTKLSEHILKTHYAGQLQKHIRIAQHPNYTEEDCNRALDTIEPPYTAEFLRKYIAYSKINISPVMAPDVIQTCSNFYVNLRIQSSNNDGEVKSISATPRQLEAIVRLAEASAKSRLSQEVANEDVLRAIKITKAFLKGVAFDSGLYDIDLIATGVSHTQRSRIIWLMDMIGVFARNNKNGIAIETEILDEAVEKGYDRDQTKKDIEKLLAEGRIFRAKDGFRVV